MLINKSYLKELIKEELEFQNKKSIINSTMLNDLIKEQTTSFLFEKKEKLLFEIGKKKEQVEELRADLEDAENQLGDLYRDPKKAGTAMTSALAEYLGRDPNELWASDGHLHPELQPQANKLLKQLKGAKKMLKKPLGADIPIEKKVEAIGKLSKFGAVGSLLIGIYQLFTGTAWGSLITTSQVSLGVLGGVSIPTGVSMAGVAGVIFFKAAFFLAALTFAIGALSIIIKLGKVVWQGLAAGADVVGTLLKPAIATGKFFLGGVGKFLGWIGRKLGIGSAEEQPEIETDIGRTIRPEEEYRGGPVREVQKLQEALNFIKFCDNLKLINS